MRICYWTPNAGGGAGKYEHYLPREIERLGNEVKIYRRPRGLAGNPLTLRLFYKSDGDIVHATTQTLSIYSYPKPERFVVTVHDIYSRHRSFASCVKRFLIKKTLKRADVVITTSDFTKKEVEEQVKISGGKIRVIPEGIDTSLYKPMDKKECRRKLGLDVDKKYILVVSSNLPHKRMDIVRAVLKEIRRSAEDVLLLKAGYGQGLEEEGVINVGFIPEEKMPILYNAADVLLHTSEYEGFGTPALEALACGVPVVISTCTPLSAELRPYARYVDLSGDYIRNFVEGIFDALEKGVDKSVIEIAQRKFSWKEIAKKTQAVYEELT
jgi:glycosyltransferase involved in cell wall biosynthesis